MHCARRRNALRKAVRCTANAGQEARSAEGIPMFKNNSTLKNWCYTIILFLLALTGSFLCMKVFDYDNPLGVVLLAEHFSCEVVHPIFWQKEGKDTLPSII